MKAILTNTPRHGEAPRARDRGPKTTETLLNERGKTHGSFDENGRISQTLKNVFREANGWAQLSFRQREALDQMALKMSRILSGNPDEPDHWDDIAGYAKLGARGEAARD